jgi:hypothetical protein
LLPQFLMLLEKCWIDTISARNGTRFSGQSFDARRGTFQPSDSEFQAVVGHRCYHSM